MSVSRGGPLVCALVHNVNGGDSILGTKIFLHFLSPPLMSPVLSCNQAEDFGEFGQIRLPKWGDGGCPVHPMPLLAAKTNPTVSCARRACQWAMHLRGGS